uniref:MHC class II beta chain N-terminal domain-containing protein n=1 Tax=Fundulus heteroclitus TaxID=8078 RepID=A0A3Q2Q3J4_FUNHE
IKFFQQKELRGTPWTISIHQDRHAPRSFAFQLKKFLNDIEFIRSNFYNKLELVRFSSSLGKFVGYTEWGVKTAEYWNSDTSYIEGLKAQRETYCLHNIGIWRGSPGQVTSLSQWM